MKKIIYLLLGLIIITLSCQTNSKLTDPEKEALVKAVKDKSQQFWSLAAKPYDTESVRNFMKFYDQNSDQAWQNVPVASVMGARILKNWTECRVNAFKF